MRSRGALRALLLAGWLAAPGAGGCGELVERVLAVADGTPILLSEAEATARLKGLTREGALEALIDQRLMLREAARLPEAALRQGEQERAYRQLLESTPEGLRASVDEAFLRQLARREAVILKYVELRFAAQVRVDEQDVRRAYEQEVGSRPAAPPLEDVADELRASLVRRALDRRIEEWVRELRSGAEIRYNR